MKIEFSEKPWWPQNEFIAALYAMTGVVERSPGICEFHFGTIEGQYRKGTLDILAILNWYPGNGQFELFIKELCKLSRKTGQPARILNFLNERFEKHCKAMPGWKECTVELPDGTITGVEYNG